ncbi:YdeI/OmpD-associated family protein [Anaerococcus sp. ENR0831]|uniref:YdeI/OmpD-associated family protein n=1 Tax=Anaerococcus martiniensis TaxID=3115615 RepID=A0ABW9M6N3_9FIRM
MDETLKKKLKLDKFEDIDLVKDAKENQTVFEGLEFKNKNDGLLDLAIAYVYSLEEMKEILEILWKNKNVKENGLIYLAYPKNKNKLGHSPIHRDDIFPFLHVNEDDGYVNGTQFKFNKMIALDENYTLIGLKKLPKKDLKKSQKPSARVDDYICKIRYIEDFLKDYPKQYDFYQSLTPGYRKGWARYVYSAKTQKTIDKRLDEMVDILGQGYKSKELYRQASK